MKHMKAVDKAPQNIEVKDAQGVKKAGLITAADGSPTAAMRLFELERNGHTPWHTHDWEHVVYIIEGKGILKSENGDAAFGAGDSLLVDPNEKHNFINTGDGRLRFICVVPLKGD
ncbi:cupin domain-containing protein [bacterium]|nr:cupin domain-containing protein [bacterium]